VTSDSIHLCIDHLRNCVTEYGYVASTITRDNYQRIWSRDGAITSLAALLTNEHELHDAARNTLNTLARYQGPHGEIPSNVDPETEHISYGGTAGRVDGNLWFIIACSQYWKRTGDEPFLSTMQKPLERVRYLLGCWEFNSRGLLYIPMTGDWADEFLQHGYVLYDQLLYLRAQQELADVHQFLHNSPDRQLTEKIARLKHLIQANYWINDSEELSEDVYHENLYEKGIQAAPRRLGTHWLPFFSPTGYGYRYDAFANVLASLFDVANDHQRAAVDAYLANCVLKSGSPLVPAFHPIITPKDEDWDDLQMTFSYSFKNEPYQYQNGGLWPMVNGFYVADFARRGQSRRAQQMLDAIQVANQPDPKTAFRGFPEFLDGQTMQPGGTQLLAWSAAGEIIGHAAVNGQEIFLEESASA